MQEVTYGYLAVDDCVDLFLPNFLTMSLSVTVFLADLLQLNHWPCYITRGSNIGLAKTGLKFVCIIISQDCHRISESRN